MQIKIAGQNKQNYPVILAVDLGISIQQLMDSNISGSPTLVLRGEIVCAYQFTLTRSTDDLRQKPIGCRLVPFAHLLVQEFDTLHWVADSNLEAFEKNRRVQEILERNTFKHLDTV